MQRQFFDSLVRMLDEVFRPHGGHSMGSDYPYFLREENFAQLLICRDGDRVVTHVGVLEKDVCYFGHRLKVGMVGGVGTHPDYRGRGLATKALLETFRRLRERGGHMMMISGGRGLYLRNGARSVGSFPECVIEIAQTSEAPDPGLELRECTPEDAPVLSAMYRLKPARFIRSLDEWTLHMAERFCANHASQFWLVRRGAHPAAYLIFRTYLENEQKVVSVTEWGGSARDAVQALVTLARQSGAQKVRWSTHRHERDLAAELERAGGSQVAANTMQGTLRIVNFELLMEALSGYMAELLGEDVARDMAFKELAGESFSVRMRGQEALVTGHAQLAEFLFGGGRDALPEPIEEGPLKEALSAVLPFPALRYDLTYA